jgi:hypothetical protein
MSILTILPLQAIFTKLPLAFLFLYKLIMPSKFNNMHFKSQIILSDFIQVLYSTRKHYAKVGYIPKHILFIIIYLLQQHKLNYRNYSEQEINIRNFIQATEHDIHMYA